MKNIRLVTVDIVGTVLRFSRPPVAQYRDVAASQGLELELDQLSESFKHQWSEMNQTFPHFGSTTPGLSSTRWWHQLVKQTFRDVLTDQCEDSKLSLMASELYSYYHSPKPYVLVPEAVDTLAELRSRKICVGAISNFDNRLHDILPSLGLAQYLQFIVTSEDAKASKPDSQIFDLASRRSLLAELKPEEILHLGNVMNLIRLES